MGVRSVQDYIVNLRAQGRAEPHARRLTFTGEPTVKPINVDRVGEQLTRRLAGPHLATEPALTKLGLALVAAPVFPGAAGDARRRGPALPHAGRGGDAGPGGQFRPLGSRRGRPCRRLTQFSRNAQSKDDTKCDYWRYCAIDGSLCACCGGGDAYLPARLRALAGVLGRHLPSIPTTASPT